MAKVPMKPPMPGRASPRKQMAASAMTPVLGVDGMKKGGRVAKKMDMDDDGMKRGGKVKKAKKMARGGKC